jgi:thioredoxin-dependent peroxiredoxin
MANSVGIQVGDPAPEFSLSDAEGNQIHLNDYRGKWVVLYFYPKDDTPGCTAEACSFRDSYEVFKEAGAEVIGVSSDSAASHEKFASKYQLPFKLVSDSKGQVRREYGVKSTLGILPGRVTYIINKEGTVEHVFSSQLRAKQHVEEALKVIRQSH